MTRQEARDLIVKLINSNKTETKYIDELYVLLHCLCEGFEECEGSGAYCEECPFRAKK